MFVITAEGDVEVDGMPISAAQVVKEIDRAGIEVRLLKLGHIQRGGPTSAQDRIYGTLLGIKAVEIMLGPMRYIEVSFLDWHILILRNPS